MRNFCLTFDPPSAWWLSSAELQQQPGACVCWEQDAASAVDGGPVSQTDRIDHSNSPLKWPILLQHFNHSVVNPTQFHAFNLLLFLTPGTLETHKGFVLTSMLFWVFTFLWSRQHVIYFPPSPAMLMIHCFIYQVLALGIYIQIWLLP